jgi:hypothetical protein
MVGLCRAVCPSVVVSNKKCKINPRSIYLLNTCKNRSGPCRPPAERDRKNRIAHGGDAWRHSARSSVLDYAGNSETGNLDRIYRIYRIRDTKAMFLVFPVFDPSQIRVHLCPPAERGRKNRMAHGGTPGGTPPGAASLITREIRKLEIWTGFTGLGTRGSCFSSFLFSIRVESVFICVHPPCSRPSRQVRG